LKGWVVKVNSKEFLSVKEFAELAKVSTQSIYKRLRNHATDELHRFTKVVNDKKLINTKALELYSTDKKLKFRQLESVKVAQPVVQLDNHTQVELEFLRQELQAKNDQIAKLSDQLDTQLEKKDTQISELNQRLAESQELNRNQQILLKNEQEKLLLIESAQEMGLFQRIFKKK